MYDPLTRGVMEWAPLSRHEGTPMRHDLFLVLALLAFTAPLPGQVVARQGDPAAVTSEEFRSPMILELPLKDFQLLPYGTGRDFKEVRRYYCEDTTISQFIVTKQHGARRSGHTILQIKGSLSVRPSFDRLATLRFDIMNGNRRLASTQVANINAEEGKTRSFSAKVDLALEEYAILFSPPETAQLRITLTLKDNS